MPDSKEVLVFSKRSVGGVRHIAELLKERGKRPVLVSENPDDRNRDACDAHIVVDWDDATLEDAVAAVDAAGVIPTAVVNLVDPLVRWQARIARHYGLPGGDAAREVLVSKARVRDGMRRLGLSSAWSDSGPAGSYPVEAVPKYPVIVKPCVDSGSSRLVRRAENAQQLRDHLRDIARAAGAGFEVIVEEHFGGREVSIDGPVIDGTFRGLLYVDKRVRDEERNHDTGLLISPLLDDHVRAGAEAMVQKISELCTDLGLARGWLHVEARVLDDGTAELIEINPRVAGGMHPAAITRTCGVDAVEAMILMALGEEDLQLLQGAEHNGELLGIVNVEALRKGRITDTTPLDEMKKIPGVVDGYLRDSFEVFSLDSENFFAAFLITGDSESDLHRTADHVRAEFSFAVE
ncbi:acetyl-CoA carboxylase biotin carboxylase subunit family protein [Streptomyces sp. NPDC050355]|uniref:acetyl-CoA carboxylase biotin carboxylase subunit family protein n=1 Tax=Streptomyces sp. NPDC050355 TaxID=3365609 RepID=UPI0037A333DF